MNFKLSSVDKPATILHVEFFGSPDKPQLVLLHGLLGSTRMWKPIAEALQDEYHVIAVDILGFGRSPKPRGPYDLTQHLDALAATAKQYGFKKPEMLVGYSLGSVLGTYAAKKRAISPKRLLLVSPPMYPTKGEMGRRIKRSPTPAVFRRGPLAIAMQSIRLRTPQVARLVAKVTHPQVPVVVVDDASAVPYRAYIRTRRRVLEQKSVIRKLPHVGAVAALVGVSDRYADIAHLAELVKGRGELRVIDRHGHSLPFTAPQEVVKMIHDLSVVKLKRFPAPISLGISTNDL